MASKTTALNSDKLVTVTATRAVRTVTIGNAGTGQTLTVTIGSNTYKSGDVVNVTYGTSWSASLTPATGYNAGTIYPASSGTVTSDFSITASAAVKKTFTVTLGTHPDCNVTIASSATTANGATSVTNGSLTGVYYGSTITVTATPSTGYTVTSLSIS